MNVTLAVIVFVTQFICCIAVKHQVKKYLPTLIVAGMMSLMVFTATLGELDPRGLVTLTVMILAGGFAAMLHLSISLIWNRMKGRK